MSVKASPLIKVEYDNGLILHISRHGANVCEICHINTNTHRTHLFTGSNSNPRCNKEGNWVCLTCRWKMEEKILNERLVIMVNEIKSTEVTKYSYQGFLSRESMMLIESNRCIGELARFVNRLNEAVSGRSQIKP